VWHGGITPENVLLTQDGTVRVADFGISHRKQDGSEAYIAPERWVESEAIDSQTDIFSLGVCLYELFCGGRPYEITRGPRRKPAEPRPSPERSLPERLAELLKACVDWEQLRRPATVTDIRRELAEIHLDLFHKPSPFAQLPPPTWDADGWNNQGMAALMLGRVEEAEAAWENALAADPNHLEAGYNLGVSRWRRGECSDDALTQQLRRNRPRPTTGTDPLHLLALVHLESGNAEAALPLLDDLVRRQPEDARLKQALTLAKRMQGARRASSRELTGHVQFVSGVGISADGQWVLSASDDQTIRVWDAANGQTVRILEGHGKRVSCLAITPDAAWALSGGDDFEMRLWDVKRSRCQHTARLQGKLFSVALSADAQRAVCSSAGNDNVIGIDGTVIQVWDLNKQRVLRRLDGHTSAAKAVAITPDGRRVVTGSDDHTVRVWDVASGTCVRVLEGHTHYVSCVAASADGQRAVSGGWDRTLRVWDVQRGRCLGVLAGHTGILTSVALSPDGRLAVSGGWDGTVRIWDLETSRCLRTFEGHSSLVTGVAVNADGSLAVSGSWDMNVRVWDVPKPGPEVCTPRLSVRVPYAQMPSAEPDADELLAEAEQAAQEQRFEDALKHIQDARRIGAEAQRERLATLQRMLTRYCTPTQLRSVRVTGRMTAPDVVTAAQWAGDGRRLFTAGRDAHLRLWDVALQRCVRTLDGHTDRIHDLRLAHGGALALSAAGDGTLRVWDLASGSAQRTLNGHRSVVTAVAFAADDRWAVSSSYDHTLRLWDLGSGSCQGVLRGHTRQVTAVCTSPDGRWIVSGGFDQSIRIWDAASGECVRVLQGHGAVITALEVVPDGTGIVSASADGTVRVWDLLSGECRQILQGHATGVTGLALHHSGRWLVSISSDGAARLWEIATGTCIDVVHSGEVALSAVAWSGDGCALAIADADRNLHLLELEWDLAAARS
jgi:WD40 repeat protein